MKVITIVVAIGLIPMAASAQVNFNKLWDKCSEDINDGDSVEGNEELTKKVQGSVDACTTWLDNNGPKSERRAVLNNRALGYNQLGKWVLALRDANEAIALDPNHRAAYLRRSKAYKGLREADLADADKKKADELKATQTVGKSNPPAAARPEAEKWGAAAVKQSHSKIRATIAWKKDTKEDAIAAALFQCGDTSDCKVVLTFNKCGYVKVGSGRGKSGMSYGTGSTEEEARTNCSKGGAYLCTGRARGGCNSGDSDSDSE